MRHAVLMVMALVAGCTTAPAPAGTGTEAEMRTGSPPELGSALNVSVAGDSVRLELHVTNATERPLRVEYATSQRYDFLVLDEAGEVVWRWSDELMFTQALGEETLLAGESRRFTDVWHAGGRTGAHEAVGRLTSMNYPVELRTRFRLPAEW